MKKRIHIVGLEPIPDKGCIGSFQWHKQNKNAIESVAEHASQDMDSHVVWMRTAWVEGEMSDADITDAINVFIMELGNEAEWPIVTKVTKYNTGE